MLLIAFAEAAIEDFAFVGLVVAVGVCGVNDFGGGGDEDAFAPDLDAGPDVESLEGVLGRERLGDFEGVVAGVGAGGILDFRFWILDWIFGSSIPAAA